MHPSKLARHIAPPALAALASTWSPAAEAGGFATARYTAEHGHPTTANATAIYYNPAALTRGKGTRLLLDGSLALRSVTYEHAQHPTDDVVGAPDAPPGAYARANVGKATAFNVLAAPTLGITSQLGQDFALGALIHVPFGGAGEFKQNTAYAEDPRFAGTVDGVQRWHVITGSLRSIYYSVAAAYKLGDAVSFGAALNLIQSAVETIRAKNIENTNQLETEGRTSLNVTGIQWSFGVGVMIEAAKDTLWLGASYQARPNVMGGMVLEGTQRTYFVKINGATTGEETPATLHQDYPDIVRLGLAYRAEPDLELRLFGDWQRWSSLKEQCVSPVGKECKTNAAGEGIEGSSPLVNQRRDWQDTIGARAGISYFTDKAESLELFAGLGYDGNAAPDWTLEASVPDADKITVAAGLRHALSKKIYLAGSYTHIQYLERDNTGKSAFTQYRGATRAPDAGGIYNSWVGVFNANLEVGF